jgi:site-specific DNA recombinase
MEAEMHKYEQTDDRTTALYCRTAARTGAGADLDNQMRRLLCHAKAQGLDSFILYADTGTSGNTFDRPALDALRQDIRAGRIGKVLATDISRLGRDIRLTAKLINRTKAQGISVVCLDQDTAADALDVPTQHHASTRGGVRP